MHNFLFVVVNNNNTCVVHVYPNGGVHDIYKVSTHILHTEMLAHEPKKLINIHEYFPGKTFSFTHLLGIHDRIMLDICKPELYTTISTVLHCMSRHGWRRLHLSTDDINWNWSPLGSGWRSHTWMSPNSPIQGVGSGPEARECVPCKSCLSPDRRFLPVPQNLC